MNRRCFSKSLCAVGCALAVALAGCSTIDLSPHPPVKAATSLPPAMVLAITQYAAPDRPVADPNARPWTRRFASLKGPAEEEFVVQLRNSLVAKLEAKGFSVRLSDVRLPEVFSRPEPSIASSEFPLTTPESREQYAKQFRSDFERGLAELKRQMPSEGAAALIVVAWRRSTAQLSYTTRPTDSYAADLRVVLADGSLAFRGLGFARAWEQGRRLGSSDGAEIYELLDVPVPVVAERLVAEASKNFPVPAGTAR